MTTNMHHIDLSRFDRMLSSFSPDEINRNNEKNLLESQAEYKNFEKNYDSGRCYICGLKFWDMNISKPCLHWLLKPKDFQKKHFELIYTKFNYHKISAFLHWVANKDKHLRNINNLEDEKEFNKVLSYTIVWKNIEWTFDCSESDYIGHKETKFPEPHYHFQMRVDGRQFINFNDHHVPFSDYDLYSLDLQRNRGDIYHHSYGPGGSGMQQALEVDPEFIIEHAVASKSKDEAVYRIQTFIQAGEKGISGDLLDQLFIESQETKKTMASLVKKHLDGNSSIETIISPVDSIPEIASRKGGRRKKNKNNDPD